MYRKLSAFFLLLWLLILPGSAWANDLLESARDQLKSGSVEEAIEIYRAWLALHTEDPLMPEVVLEFAPVLNELSEKRSLLARALEVFAAPELHHAILIMLAETEEQLGELSSAQRRYRDASFALPGKKDFPSLLRSALLSFELGEYTNAEAQARVIIDTSHDIELAGTATVLLSRIYYATDRAERAYALLLDGRSIRKNLGADGLFWLVRLAELTGDQLLAEQARRLLSLSHSGSLEYSILFGGAVRTPNASALLEAKSDSAVTAEPSGGASTVTSESKTGSVPSTPESINSETPEHVSIQTGSFTVRENAEYAANDLGAEGFRTAIKERTVGGTVYYRVVVPDVPRDQLARIVLELKESGFEGFPIYE